jgi:hypothetical protein
MLACRSQAVPSASASFTERSGVHVLNGESSGPGAPNGWIDCVDVLRVTKMRGIQLANVRRFGEDNPSLRVASRLGDLATNDLRAFCDWEACIATNGYAHTCWVNDAGSERCRVCDGSGDCEGRRLNQDDCVAHATDTGRAQCHVGLLEECLIQQALRGPADGCQTDSCALSDQACAGQCRATLLRRRW